MEHPNQSQSSPITNLIGHPVYSGIIFASLNTTIKIFSIFCRQSLIYLDFESIEDVKGGSRTIGVSLKGRRDHIRLAEAISESLYVKTSKASNV